MNKDIKKAWVAALRSGEYEQGKNYLHTSDDKFCCLGVLCDLAVKAGKVEMTPPHSTPAPVAYRYNRSFAMPPSVVQEWAGLEDADPYVDWSGGEGNYTLSSLNDLGTSFSDIADLIEKQL